MNTTLSTIKTIYLLPLTVFSCLFSFAQNYDLNKGWKYQNIKQVKEVGEAISITSYSTNSWKPATVPGTVLTNMLNNKEVPDPFFGMNNDKIPDIYDVGRDFYTYWFVNDFSEAVPKGEDQVWLNFRGINYSCEIFINGKKVNTEPFKGMYLRKRFNITKLLAANGKNRLAVIVYPPDVVGNPNGGQGGDGTIAKNVGLQYTAGWDWIKPIRDRNTGIWDKVSIEKTGQVSIIDPHIVTEVPGKRETKGLQDPAIIKASATLLNASNTPINGALQYRLNGELVQQAVTLSANEETEIQLPNFTLAHPKLWWPSNYGESYLYPMELRFVANDGKTVSDKKELQVGVREIQTYWNAQTRSREVAVNGQKIFVKGGNWIISDAMLRFSKERYDAEIRFHRDMNLNLIRIWGGALVERPEFYEACDRYGLLVLQDFWMSGDCNGRWEDPMKKDDQWTRRQYPDDHHLFLESAADMVKMIRNHPSLAFYCGGNEITPPNDILVPLRDSILPRLDGTRWFVDYSNSDAMSQNDIGGNGDGPYGIQDIKTFWTDKTWPFNSEVGSVGVGDLASLQRFLPVENQVAPVFEGLNEQGRVQETVDSIWQYHTYISYGQHLEPYGKVKDLEDFANKAQLVNYDQYRGLMEGFSSHMWDWYTGTIIWKTQNPWTSLRGQMYDYYLDPNACLYGLRSGSEPLHAMYNPVDGFISIVNNHFEKRNDIMLVIKAYDMQGKAYPISQVFSFMEPSSVKKIMSVKKQLDELSKEKGAFLQLQLLDADQVPISDNFYWLPNEKGVYSGLIEMPTCPVEIQAEKISPGEYTITLVNKETDKPAFFNRLSLIDKDSQQRLLPTFYSDNYISVLPGEKKIIRMSIAPELIKGKKIAVTNNGWNVDQTTTLIP